MLARCFLKEGKMLELTATVVDVRIQSRYGSSLNEVDSWFNMEFFQESISEMVVLEILQRIKKENRTLEMR